MVIYFSGTGNSRYCAEMLADGLGDEITNSFSFIREGIRAELSSEKPWVFVCPTYAWYLPHIFEDFIRSGSFSGSRDAYFIMTCGSDIGGAGIKLKKLCSELNMNYKGVLQVVMPENYIAMFNAPSAEDAERIVLAAHPALKAAICRITENADLPSWKPGIIAKLKTGPVNAGFYKSSVKSGPFYSTDACIGCGKCETLCVLKNISIVDGRPVWGNSCTHCMACICSCPEEAIEYGKTSKGKPRYQCMEYRGNV